MSNSKRKSRRRWLLVMTLLIVAGLGLGAYFYFRKREVIVTVQTEKATRRSITELRWVTRLRVVSLSFVTSR